MTCVVGVELLDNGRRGVIMGADSCSSNGWTETVQTRPKLIRVREGAEKVDLLVGVCGSWRFADLVEYHLEAPERPRSEPPERYVRKHLLKAIRAAAKDHGLLKVEHSVETLEEASALVAYQGSLYRLQSDLSVLPAPAWGDAVGSGAALAMGAMLAAGKLSADKQPLTEAAGRSRLRVALEVAAEAVTTVEGPFHFETLWATRAEAKATPPPPPPNRLVRRPPGRKPRMESQAHDPTSRP